MVRTRSALALRLDFGDTAWQGRGRRLTLVSGAGEIRGPEKYRVLDLKRRRAQIRARRLLNLLS
jgi:hypothetical protein